ncbi:MAG: arginine--tRNA ligase [Candidatus Omnitrophica bacterium]|nr:arginine--tRNA ligase [Candidatus Omnitrophota bacterium]
MSDLKKSLTERLALAIEKTIGVPPPAADVEASFEIPREERFGDFSSNIALKLSREHKRPPRALAEDLKKQLEEGLKDPPLARRVERIAVEGPGFLNFYRTRAEQASVLERIEKEGERFGRSAPEKKKKILLEFVSANPTGPLTVAHGRQAALGDSLARILEFCGHRVTREYYNNDEGVQINTLGQSLAFRVKQILEKDAAREMPENYYRGEYLVGIAKEFIKQFNPKPPHPKDFEEKCRIFARDKIMEGIQKDLKDFGVAFDSYYSQEILGKSGRVEKTLETLKAKGVVYESEGALWFRSTDFGDDKDRVLKKSDGSYTYLTPDISYHHHKFERGFDELINILGPDHHGYIARLKASQEALGHDPSRLRVLIAQLVTLFEGEKQVRMSTRAGEFVTLREILDEVGRDAGRFFFLVRKFDAHLDFDLALAKSQTPDNPVFYIQYAHARIESIKNHHRETSGAAPSADSSERLTNEHERRVLRLLSQYREVVIAAERTLEPYRVVAYLEELAAAFHKFYAENRVVSDDAALTHARMRLVTAIQTVFRSGLGLLGVSAPLKM